jgi:hypothetical protein
MTTKTPYLLLSQLAADYRRRGMVETAAIVESEHEALASRFGPLETFPVPPRALWLQDYIRSLQLVRSRALEGDQYGRVRHSVALTSEIVVSLLAQFLRTGEQLTPRDAEQLADTVRRATEAAFQRIENSANSEAGKAHLEARIAMQYQQRQFSRQQEQQQAAGEFIRAAARVQALKAEAT